MIVLTIEVRPALSVAISLIVDQQLNTHDDVISYLNTLSYPVKTPTEILAIYQSDNRGNLLLPDHRSQPRIVLLLEQYPFHFTCETVNE